MRLEQRGDSLLLWLLTKSSLPGMDQDPSRGQAHDPPVAPYSLFHQSVHTYHVLAASGAT